MTQNPYLHVFSGNGYYDLATPFFKTEYELNHLNLAPELQKHITVKHYEDGHMIYLHEEALKNIHNDLNTFYTRATSGK
ncbi:MAG: peptidase S1, partial [Ginsengibacter sp.]